MTIYLCLTVLWSLQNVLVIATSTSLETESRQATSTRYVN